MKFTKLSLIAALAVTTAMAGDAKISGDAKLFYGTNDAGTASLFDKGSSIGDSAVSLDYSRGVADGVTLNLGVTGVSTLGLEKDLVNSTWISHGASVTTPGARTSGATADVIWLDTANIAINMGKSTVVVGRQELDTPFFKSEKWNIAANTFDAAVLVNQDIENTTLVGAWVGRGNGVAGSTVALDGQNFQGGMQGFAGTPGKLGNAGNPAYAVGAITKAIPMTALQVWGYKIPSVATAQWVQADIAATKDVSVGLQYAGTKLTATSAKTSAFAAKVGYEANGLSASAAYSKRDNKAGIDIANIATGHTNGSESNLYTEAYWNLGRVGAQGAQAVAVDAAYNFGAVKTGIRYVKCGATGVANDLDEVSITAGTQVGPLNAEVAYINEKVAGASSDNAVLVMLTAPFSL